MLRSNVKCFIIMCKLMNMQFCVCARPPTSRLRLRLGVRVAKFAIFAKNSVYKVESDARTDVC